MFERSNHANDMWELNGGPLRILHHSKKQLRAWCPNAVLEFLTPAQVTAHFAGLSRRCIT